MDAQTTVAETASLAALVQCIAKLEVERGYVTSRALEVPEALDENRFLAARDGMEAKLLDPARDRLVPARDTLKELLEACLPFARDLGCEAHLAHVPTLARSSGAERQLARACEGGVPAAMAELADEFLNPPLAEPEWADATPARGAV